MTDLKQIELADVRPGDTIRSVRTTESGITFTAEGVVASRDGGWVEVPGDDSFYVFPGATVYLVHRPLPKLGLGAVVEAHTADRSERRLFVKVEEWWATTIEEVRWDNLLDPEVKSTGYIEDES